MEFLVILRFISKLQSIKNFYFTFTGLGMLYYVFGYAVLHSIVDIVAVYLILLICGGSFISVCLCWTITMGHLLCGYAYVMYTEQAHPISWTIPHCVLVLKLVGLAYNIYDGKKDPKLVTNEQKKFAIHRVPSLLEIMSFAYFFGSILVGPQISFKRHIMFTEGQLFDYKTTPSSVPAALLRLLGGVFCSALYASASHVFPSSYLVSDEYMGLGFPQKIAYMVVCGRVEMWKLTAVWLLAEGVCIMSGISYEKKENNQKQQICDATNDTCNGPILDDGISWYALSNVHVLRSELSTSLIDTIKCFNITTNNWIAMYIFKRLKFLGIKWLSRLLTLLFISLWHGVWPGYLITFMLEFLGTLAEKTFVTYWNHTFGYFLKKASSPARGVFVLAAFLLRNCLLMYPMTTFILLDWSRCYQFMRSVYFYYPILLLTWLLLYKNLLKPRTKEKPL